MWIESHPGMENHPKLLHLCQLTGWDKDTAVGKLHRFWWWCTSYAEDGDLRKYGVSSINSQFGLPLDSDCLFLARFIDRRPYLRVHDWWDYFGRYLKLKYRNNSKKLMQIESVATARQKTRLSHAKDTLKSRRSEHTGPDVPDVKQTGKDVTDVPQTSKDFASRFEETAKARQDELEYQKILTHHGKAK